MVTYYQNYELDNPITWIKVFQEKIQFNSAYKVLPSKGNMAWEYNPLRNYRLSQDMYEYNGSLHTYTLFKKDYGIKTKEEEEAFKAANKMPDGVLLYLSGELVDFITDELSFDISHPVSIIPSYSYDGSVDLILNDGKNLPRLINTRFSATGLNTYEINNRKGNNDTNIYDLGDLFDIDTSLYKKTNKIPKVIFDGTPVGGDMKIGNYHFYFKYSDADGNETDFIAESGLVSVFKGVTSPIAISTGLGDENSLKRITFTIENIDSGYQYLHVYYTRSSAVKNGNIETSAKKINYNYNVNNNGICNIVITGNEEEEDIPISDINLLYNVILSAKSLAICLNMLFLANVQRAEIPYTELEDLSLRFYPYLAKKEYPLQMNETYNIQSQSKGYYDPKFIYNFTGYWDKDLYRLGIVYILKDNTLSPVFNIRGGEKIGTFPLKDNDGKAWSSYYSNFPVYTQEDPQDPFSPKHRNFITYDEAFSLVIKSGSTAQGSCLFENVKGVVQLTADEDTDKIFGFDIRTDYEVIQELKKYVKGFFFVRQKRMPLTLCLGITIGIENNSNLPAIPTVLGITDIQYEYTYTETKDKDPDAIHYVMEGFLGRYTFKLKPKSSGFWSKFFKALGAAVLVAAIVAVSVITCGGGLVVAGAAIALSVSSSLAVTAGISAAIAAGAILATTVTVAGILSVVLAVELARNKGKAAVKFRGRNEPIPSGYKREEVEKSRLLDADYKQRIILVDLDKCRVDGVIVPDYTVNPPYYNLLFTGDEFVVESAISLPITRYSNCGYFTNDNYRHFYISGYKDVAIKNNKNYVRLAGVADSIPMVGIKNYTFRARGGSVSEPLKYSLVNANYKDDNLNACSDFVRGNFGPYVAMTGYQGPAATTLNIKIPGYNEANMLNYIKMRIADHSEYLAISDRIDISECKPSIDRIGNVDESYKFQLTCYRGDCYICLFTLRINRNFNDKNAPYNESIVDPKTWRDNYDINERGKFAKINTGDLNAVELGMWTTFRVRSTYNLNIRTEDGSWLEEAAESGHIRSYYPKAPMSTDGSYKIPESSVYNLGFSKSVSDRYNFEVPNVPYVKNWFGTRVMYSDINITDGFRNGFRSFKGTAYRDYTREYGEITKILELNGNLFVAFEHGLGILEVNERAVAALASSGNAYITTNNVLPEKPMILSDTFGSQWADSIIKVPISAGSAKCVVFGVDTVAKKIWMCDGGSVQCISDFKVLEFLNLNITLGEREHKPILGVRNVKTFYNAFKLDVMFTFYDNLEGFEEKAWNLCYNLTLKKFITFYSWVPSFMENIDNIPFSFNRDVSKWIGKLGVSKSEKIDKSGISVEHNDFADGIVLSNNIIDSSKTGVKIAQLGLANRVLPFGNELTGVQTKIVFEVVRDSFRNDRMFTVDENNWLCFALKPSEAYEDEDRNQRISEGEEIYIDGDILKEQAYTRERNLEYYKPEDLFSEIYYRNTLGNVYSDWDTHSNVKEWPKTNANGELTEYIKAHKDLPIFKNRAGLRQMIPEAELLNGDQIIRLVNIRANIFVKFKTENKTLFDVYKASKGETDPNEDGFFSCGYYESQVALIVDRNMQFLSTDFWKHGLAGLIDIADDIYPTFWYGKQHPFEFECIVVNDPSVHKIFLNLEIISNKAKPESFHFEVIGDTYDFAKDKPNMFFRQEARRALFLYNGVNITYNRDFLKITPRQNERSAELVYSYYERQDKLEEIKDTYVGDAINSSNYDQLNSYKYMYDFWAGLTPNKDYRHLSGAEIVYYKNRNEYRVWQHLPAIDIDDLPQDAASTVIRGNCLYLEDRWKVSINPLLVCYKNEYIRKVPGALCVPENSTWPSAYKSPETKLPPITIRNTSLPSVILKKGAVDFPNYLTTDDFPSKNELEGLENALYKLYDLNGQYSPIDFSNWLSSASIYMTNFGTALNRKETDIRDKFMKVRIRYSGKELAVIDFLNTLYSISYA